MQRQFHQQIDSINITFPMTQYSTTNYHFCTLNDAQMVKTLPTLNFVQKLIDICHAPISLFESQQKNRYDRKNHILYINNYNSYASVLKEKYGRTVASFEKQLHMIGFKKRKIRQHSTEQYVSLQTQQSKLFTKRSLSINQTQEQKSKLQNQFLFEGQQQNNRKLSLNLLTKDSKIQKIDVENGQKQIKYMLVWKTNRMELIEKQMKDLEQTLQQEIERAIRIKEEVEKRKRQLDRQMETLLLTSLVNDVGDTCFAQIDTNMEVQTSEKVRPPPIKPPSIQLHLNKALQNLKRISNLSQQQATQLVRKVSKCSQSELQLYRALIYKQTHVHRSMDEE